MNAPDACAPRILRRFPDALDTLPDPGVLAAALFDGVEHAFWLDSSSAGIPGGAPARWSVLGVPDRVLRQDSCPGRVLELRPRRSSDEPARRSVGASILDALEREVVAEAQSLERPETRAGGQSEGSGSLEEPAVPEMVRELCSGWVGYLGHEISRELDAVRPPHGRRPLRPSSPGCPDALWMKAGDVLVLDSVGGDAWAAGSPGWIDRVTEALAGPGARVREHAPEPPPARFRAPDRSAYEKRVRRSLEEIGAGKSYEVCLTAEAETVLDQPLTLSRALSVYRRQRRNNPAPYAAFLWFGDGAVLSSSPERFLSVDAGGRCEAKPIKGTVPRPANPAEDVACAAWLRSDPKSRAENLMIVDLMRNDFSRVCDPASVRVPVLMGVESYASLHQLVSTVEGRLSPGRGVVGLIRAAFPPGSMTGAPKARTLEIIDGLEDRSRGVYSGALGRIGPLGADLSVVIRTLVLAAEGSGTRVRVAAGGAVVADSDPAEEYAEMLAKMRAPLPAGWALAENEDAGPGRLGSGTAEKGLPC